MKSMRSRYLLRRRLMESLKDNLEKMLADGRDDEMLRFGLGSAYFNEKNKH